jgi:hypothetical protein
MLQNGKTCKNMQKYAKMRKYTLNKAKIRAKRHNNMRKKTCKNKGQARRRRRHRSGGGGMAGALGLAGNSR